MDTTPPTQQHTHRPVLLTETLSALNVCPSGRYVDATFGRGGHTGALLTRLNAAGRVLAIDRDPEAAAHAATQFGHDPRLTFVHAAFGRLQAVLQQQQWEQVDGILLDLGVSSPQLDQPARGFSFQHDGPLDMRMDCTSGPTAAAWLQQVSVSTLETVLKTLGEERFARRVARAIITAREAAPLERTSTLAHIVSAAVPTREPGKHPATRTFQALRIALNRELEELEAVLPQAVAALAPGGRLAVISFHSLEDRIVKHFLRAQAQGQVLPLGLPVQGRPSGATLRLIGRGLRAGAPEVTANPRARSATLRVAEKLP